MHLDQRPTKVYPWKYTSKSGRGRSQGKSRRLPRNPCGPSEPSRPVSRTGLTRSVSVHHPSIQAHFLGFHNLCFSQLFQPSVVSGPFPDHHRPSAGTSAFPIALVLSRSNHRKQRNFLEFGRQVPMAIRAPSSINLQPRALLGNRRPAEFPVSRVSKLRLNCNLPPLGLLA